MTDSKLMLVSIQGTPEGDSVKLTVENTSSYSLEVRILDPYIGVRLFQLDGTELRKASLFAWKQEDYHRLVKPGCRFIVILYLGPFWEGINEEVLVRYTLGVAGRLIECEAVLPLHIPTIEEKITEARRRRHERSDGQKGMFRNRVTFLEE